MPQSPAGDRWIPTQKGVDDAEKGSVSLLTQHSSRPRQRNESPVQLEGEGRQRRQMNQDRMFAAHPFASFALNATEISYVAAAVGFAVGVDDLAIEAGLGNAQPIVVTHHRGRVHDEYNNVTVS